MVAVTESTSMLTEFAGTKKVFAAKIDGVAGTGLTLTVEELYSIDAVLCTLAQMSTATHNSVCVSAVSSNVITLVCTDGAGIAATGTVVDFYVVVIGTAQGNQ